ncbi:hypothetical protein BX666DRAFT_1886651 [Dichotomocladium elegans]|nr:hypothetical protein BX666DRAFT_1886651 [Dichotomocladium elegans]
MQFEFCLCVQFTLLVLLMTASECIYPKTAWSFALWIAKKTDKTRTNRGDQGKRSIKNSPVS